MQRNKFRFLSITDGDSFSIPFSVLENYCEQSLDLIIIKRATCQQMWMSAVDFIFNEGQNIDDGFYRICNFQFKPDTLTFNETQLKILSKFHHSYLNHKEFTEYILSDKFIKVLQSVASKRVNNTITPSKEDVFDIFNTPLSELEIPDSITYINNNPMEEWKEFIDIIKQCKDGRYTPII